MVERVMKATYLIRYVREVDRQVESWPLADKITTAAAAPSEFKLAINYILGGLYDDQYQSKRKQKKLLRAAMVKVVVNVIHIGGSHEETKPIDGPISYSPINQNKVIVPIMMHLYSPYVLVVLMFIGY